MKLISQYQESINLINYIKVLTSESSNLREIFRQLIEDRTIDKLTGVNLDIIGSIVGQERLSLNDEDYRQAIKMRIVNNSSIIDRESLIYSIKFIFGENRKVELKEEHCRVIINVSGEVPSKLQFYLDQKLILKPAGVRYDIIFDNKIFGYDAINEGYGDINNTAIGGSFL